MKITKSSSSSFSLQTPLLLGVTLNPDRCIAFVSVAPFRHDLSLPTRPWECTFGRHFAASKTFKSSLQGNNMEGQSAERGQRLTHMWTQTERPSPLVCRCRACLASERQFISWVICFLALFCRFTSWKLIKVRLWRTRSGRVGLWCSHGPRSTL